MYRFALALVAGLAANCIVVNENHCGFAENPDRTVCGPGFFCSSCHVENDGCVPEGTKIKDEKCEVDPVLGSSSGSTGEVSNTSSSSDETGSGSTNSSSTGESTSGGSSEESSTAFSSTGKIPICGDGLFDEGETCDDGNQIGDDGCSALCQLEVCGNGVVDPGEACDDGNQDNSDFCSAACTISFCGDGFLQQDQGEECDDGNILAGDSCDAACQWSRRKVFVTSTSFPGNLVGVAGADTYCQLVAEFKGFARHQTFKAWVSDGNISASDRFDKTYKAYYVLLDNNPIAFGWLDLTDGTLGFPINIDEGGKPVPAATVWTNTKTSGGSFGADTHCNAWEDGTANYEGVVGTTKGTGSSWTDYAPPQACSATAHLYCFEDRL